MLYALLRPILFQLPAEFSHDVALWLLQNGGRHFICPPPIVTEAHAVQIANLIFPNKIGLAAGLDKQANCVSSWQKMGFGFIELGTVTPKPQPGNPKPRLFRYASDKAIINRFGFNSCGIDKFIENLSKFLINKKKCLWGINIGKNKNTENDLAYQDYVLCLEKAYYLADYVTVNISSPNTKDLRALQEPDSLAKLLDKILTSRITLQEKYKKYVPIFIKISPDLSYTDLKEIIRILMSVKIDGIITTNTTIWRPTSDHVFYQESGGLSGDPLFNLSLECLKKCADLTSGKMPIIASGGINSVAAAQLKLAAGATLIQVYTGLIYSGPKLIQDLIKKT